MSWKSLTCLTVLCALVAGQALAAPTVNVAGTVSGGNINWTVSFTPDAALLAGGLKSMATELALEFTNAQVGPVTINPNWMETINGTPIVNPGNNPYTNTITEGVTTHTNVASELGGGTVNAIFAALGSTAFETGGAKLALSFTTSGTTGTVNWGGILTQDPTAAFVPLSGSLTIGAPSFIPGDFNGGGQVELGDLNLVLNNWGALTPPIPSGWTGDQPEGQIDLGELNKVLNNWGNIAPGALAVSASPVPEPASIASVLGLLGLGAVMIRRRSA